MSTNAIAKEAEVSWLFADKVRVQFESSYNRPARKRRAANGVHRDCKAGPKIDQDTAALIRKSKEPSAVLARRYGISMNMVQKIRRGLRR